MEVMIKYNMSFIMVPKVKNEPGVGEEVMKCLYELGVEVEYFNALATRSDSADIVVMVKSGDVERVVSGVSKIKGRIGGAKPTVATELAGIVITGLKLKESSEVLYKSFAVCARFKTNVITAYTTLTSINLFVESKNLTADLMEDLRKEFEEK